MRNSPTLLTDFPRNLPEFDRRFGTEEACRDYLISVRWPGGWICPRCSIASDPWRPKNRDLLVCSSCEYQCSLKVGTAFEKSKRPLTDWFKAIYFITEHSKQGVSALGLMRFMGFGKIATAWTWLHKLRAYMSFEVDPPLHGEVEVDEAFFGGYLEGGKPGLGSENKIKVAFAVEKRRTGCGRVRAKVITDRSGPSLRTFVKETVAVGTQVSTDWNRGYFLLAQEGFSIDARKCNRNGVAIRGKQDQKITNLHLPLVNRVTSLMKRIIYTTHQGSFSAKHLQRQLDEFCFRFDRRDAKIGKPLVPMRRFQELFHRLVEGPCEPYWKIIGRQSPTLPIKPTPIERPWEALKVALETYAGVP